MEEEQKGIPGSTLKIIAIVTMFIDHAAAIVLERYIPVAPQTANAAALNILYYVMRGIGRLAFPIFCFLLVEGFFYTRSRLKYAIRLLIFSIISEVPFDLAVYKKIFDFSYQNVFFTLLIGFLTIWALDTVKRKEFKRVVNFGLTFVIMACGMAAAYFLFTDYSFAGVLAIVVMYSLHERKTEAVLWGCILLTVYSAFEVFALIDTVLVKMYNGKRGLKLKYFFYAFYPAHLLLLYLTAVLLGLA